MSSKAGGLYGGIQFSSGTTFSSSVLDNSPSTSIPISNEPDVPTQTPTQPMPMRQEQPAPATQTVAEPGPGGASGKATAGIFLSTAALKA